MRRAFYCIPSARPGREVASVVAAWQAQGYGVALWRDDMADDVENSDVNLYGRYPGYAVAVNLLAEQVLNRYPHCQWIVTGGDDIYPDPNKRADEIAAECTEHFGGTFGVMQPTGDRWANGSIDRIAGSPWMGREFCERMYGGNGPLFPGYEHMFVDEELLNVAEKLGVYWRRQDLTHFHNHFLREGDNGVDHRHQVPPHLVKWNTQAHWNTSKALFQSRKAQGFPGHEPLPVEVPA